MSETKSPSVAIIVALIGLFGTISAIFLEKYLPHGEIILGSSTTGQSGKTVIDPEGNHYPVVHLVGKNWLAKNLNYYVRGSCCYDNNPANCKRYGKLYTWEAAQLACQALGPGWRLPSDDDWKELLLFYGGYEDGTTLPNDLIVGDPEKSSKALKKGGISGFEALSKGGWRSYDGEFLQIDIGVGTYWSCTEEQVYGDDAISYQLGRLFTRNSSMKKFSFSCRCVQN